MSKVIVNKPTPVVQPPTTYNIELDENEFLALRSLVSRRDNTSDKVLEWLRQQMQAVSRPMTSPFTVVPSQRAIGAYHIRLKTPSELAGS